LNVMVQVQALPASFVPSGQVKNWRYRAVGHLGGCGQIPNCDSGSAAVSLTRSLLRVTRDRDSASGSTVLRVGTVHFRYLQAGAVSFSLTDFESCCLSLQALCLSLDITPSHERRKIGNLDFKTFLCPCSSQFPAVPSEPAFLNLRNSTLTS
jgi:hypothetical protein